MMEGKGEDVSGEGGPEPSVAARNCTEGMVLTLLTYPKNKMWIQQKKLQ